eukprot:TCALIF_12281-PA protein Name:"Similar to NINL Ninein-like protein (Homo sapiens)" AED:0.06 eAED:0.06 QI:7/0.87/0.70/0.94/0.87/0.94/17/222/1708
MAGSITSGSISFERCDSYEDQLKSLFISCCDRQQEELDENGLVRLCQELELSQSSQERLARRLLQNAPNGTVSFEVFKEALVVLLEQLHPVKPEVEPKLVVRNKKYGRKSRPSSVDISDEELEESVQERLNSNHAQAKDLSPSSVDDGIIQDICHEGGRFADFHFDSADLDGVDEREYLRSIWQRLRVGRDGYLDRQELAEVCEVIGMEKLPIEIVDQLFKRLDADGDGRVEFEDLLSLFQSSKAFSKPSISAGPSSSVPLIASNPESLSPVPSLPGSGESSVHHKSPQSRQGSANSSRRSNQFSHHSSPLSESLKQTTEFAYFSALDPDHTGLCSTENVVEYLESIGVTNPGKMILDLRISLSQPELDLKTLSGLMDEDLDQTLDGCPHNVSNSVLVCQSEVRYLRSSLDNVAFERDKLRLDVSEANQRSLLLAQEIDDQNARLEKSSQVKFRELEQKYVDQIRELQGELSSEKEQHQYVSLELDSRQRMISEKMNEKESKMREQIRNLEKENERLEKDHTSFSQKLQDMVAMNQSLQIEVDSMGPLKERLLELEGSCATGVDQTILELTERVDELNKMNKDLRDQIDELHMQAESAKLSHFESRRSSAPFFQSATTSNSLDGKPVRFSRSLSLKHPLKRGRNPTVEEDPGEDSNAPGAVTSSEESSISSRVSSPREGKVPRKSVKCVISEEDFLDSNHPETHLTSLSVELGTANLPVIDSPPSSLGSIDDSLVMGNFESSFPSSSAVMGEVGEIRGIEQEEPSCCNRTTAALRAQIAQLEVRCQRLQEEKKTQEDELLEEVESLRQAKENEISRIRHDLDATNMKLNKVLAEKDHLDENLRQSTLINVSLSTEMKKVDSEMEAVQSRLLTALGEIDHCKGKQASDEDRITVLTGKCSKLEDRLRESVITLGSPASSLSRSSSSASSSRTSSTIHSSSSNENIQVIAVRHNMSPPQLKRSNSPCVSKIFVNSEQSSPVAGARQPRQLVSSASFSGLFKSHSLSIHSPGSSASSSSSSCAGHQPSSLPLIPTSNAIKRSRSTSDNERAKVQVFQLEQHCKNLEGELDHVKDEIIKILSDKTSASKENQSLKHYAKAYELLKNENADLKKELAMLKLNPPKSPSLSSGSSRGSIETSTDHHDIDRSSPDGQEFESVTTSSTASSPSTSHKPRILSEIPEQPDSLDDDTSDDKRLHLEKELESVKSEQVKEREAWSTKISQLEESLELMRSEFENMEDYWQGKLDEERQFYENQLKTSDANFKDLEMKMREYEDLLMTSESVSNPEAEKLSTIAETVSLEGQVTDLETEILELKNQIEELTREKEENEQILEDQWHEKILKEQEGFEKEKETLQSRILDLVQNLKKVSLDLEKANQEKEVINVKYNQDVSRLQGSYTKMQEHLRRTQSVTGSFPPQSRTKIQIKQPSSLPPEIIGDGSAQADLQRLHEFRRLIQDECDQLLLRRDQLQQDVMEQPGLEGPSERPHLLHSSTTMLDGGDGMKRGQHSAIKDLALFKTSALSSMARAYKAVLQDIEREKATIAEEMQELRSSKQKLRKGISFNPIKALQNRLKHQEARCKHLRDALQVQQDQSDKILQVTRDQHRSEIENLETLIKVNQEILHSQMSKYNDQMHRLIQSDALVKQLSTQNESLILAIQMLEDTLNGDETGEDTRECLTHMCKILTSDDSPESSCSGSDCGSSGLSTTSTGGD